MFAVVPLDVENRCYSRRKSSRAMVDFFECRYCKRGFTKEYNLLIHERTHRTEVSSSSACDICGKSFRKAETLKYHRMVHTPSPPMIPRELTGFLTECATY